MMVLKKVAQFLAALVLGLMLILISYPAHSQEYPSFEECFDQVTSYTDYTDLDEYAKDQVYCLFVVELIGGGIQVEQDYDDGTLEQLMLNALEDSNDSQDNDPDSALTYEEIRDEFSGDELTELIRSSIREASEQSREFQFTPFQIAIDRTLSKRTPTSSLSKQYTNRSRTEAAVSTVAANAGQGVGRTCPPSGRS